MDMRFALYEECAGKDQEDWPTSADASELRLQGRHGGPEQSTARQSDRPYNSQRLASAQTDARLA